MTERRFMCSAAAISRNESVIGTASRIDRWLLIEVLGPWGARALPQARGVNDAALLGLQQRAKTMHARTLLIRRSGRVDTTTGVPGETVDEQAADARRVFIADSRPGHERLLTCTIGNDELAGLHLPFDGDSTSWAPSSTLVGVCTHGSHDPCCAVRGRPVAAALARTHPAISWEISHIGGDRFAANVLVLPAGHYLGQLTAGAASHAIDRLLAGQRPDPYYRGRSCWAMPVQAALAAAGEHLGITALDALQPRHVSRGAPDEWQVTIDVAGRDPVSVEITQRAGPDASKLTCRANDEQLVPAWAVHSIR